VNGGGVEVSTFVAAIFFCLCCKSLNRLLVVDVAKLLLLKIDELKVLERTSFPKIGIRLAFYIEHLDNVGKGTGLNNTIDDCFRY
jgi:hypothetical protein